MTTTDHGKIVSTLAFVLRHDPTRFGLELDDEGWASLDDVLIAIRFDRYDWASSMRKCSTRSSKGRIDSKFAAARIRATYGHSVELGKLPPIARRRLCYFMEPRRRPFQAFAKKG